MQYYYRHYTVGLPLVSLGLVCFLVQLAATDGAAQYLHYQPNGQWNISEQLNKILQERGSPTVYNYQFLKLGSAQR